MNTEGLAERFEAERPRLQTVAYRLLDSHSEADDAVQEAWLRLSRSDAGAIENLGGWLTTVVARVCLDMLRSRKSRREESLTQDDDLPAEANPEDDVITTESVGLAMITVFEHLAPAERVAFVLHDVFGVSFEEIAGIVDRTPAAARQLASRGRRRVRGVSQDQREPDTARHRRVVEAFFRASRAGDFQALLALLDPNVVLRGDPLVMQMGARNGWLTSELHGPDAVAKQFDGQALAAQLALIDGMAGAVWAPGGTVRVAFGFSVRDGRVTGIELTAEPDRLEALAIEILA